MPRRTVPPRGQAGGRAARGPSAEPPRNTTPRVDGHREACPTPPPIVGTNPGPQRCRRPSRRLLRDTATPNRRATHRCRACPPHSPESTTDPWRGAPSRAPNCRQLARGPTAATPGHASPDGMQTRGLQSRHRRSRRRQHSDAEYVRRISPVAATDSPARLQVGARARAAPGRARPLAHRRPTRGHAPSMFHVKPPLHVKRPYRSTRGPGHAPNRRSPAPPGAAPTRAMGSPQGPPRPPSRPGTTRPRHRRPVTHRAACSHRRHDPM